VGALPFVWTFCYTVRVAPFLHSPPFSSWYFNTFPGSDLRPFTLRSSFFPLSGQRTSKFSQAGNLMWPRSVHAWWTRFALSAAEVYVAHVGRIPSLVGPLPIRDQDPLCLPLSLLRSRDHLGRPAPPHSLTHRFGPLLTWHFSIALKCGRDGLFSRPPCSRRYGERGPPPALYGRRKTVQALPKHLFSVSDLSLFLFFLIARCCCLFYDLDFDPR